MAGIDFTKDARSLTESDLAGLSADELRILGRLVLHEVIRGTSPFDPTGVEMQTGGGGYGCPQRARVIAADVPIALLKRWTKA